MKYLDKIKKPEDIKNKSISELKIIAQEIRSKIIEVTSKNGGHLAASLGCVELTLALHYVLNAPEDILIWDVGHQSYAHKLITGRYDSFETLRLLKGISGFPHRDESKYDNFTVGHSSTSIAAALGFAKARDLNNETNKIVAVIGDGAMTSGLAFEALNNASNVNTNVTVILNDNDMSIAPNVGAMSEYLSKIISHPGYNKIKDEIENTIYNLPGIGSFTKVFSKKIQESIKNLVVPKIIFEEFGFRYFGPVDGHNIEDLIELFKKVIYYNGPKIIHVRTKKGKGYSYAETSPDFYHGVGPFDVATGKTKGSTNISYTKAFGETIVKLAEKNENIVAITAAMPEGTGLTKFKTKFPNRFFDVGITEDFSVTFAAGLSAGKKKPVLAIYSSFLQRGIDQLYHDVALQQDVAPLIAIDRAGLVGADGPTHHGTLDLSYLLMIPEFRIMVPADEYDFIGMLELGTNANFPAAVRYPRGNILGERIPEIDECKLEWGTSKILNEGEDAIIIGVGPIINTVSEVIKENGLSIKVVNLRFIKPLNEKFILEAIEPYKKIITIEENSIVGGFGSYLTQFILSKNIFDKKILNLGYPDKFIESGKVEELYEIIGLDKNGLKKKIGEFIK
jgi:1-deoxy-D-xylulose-5-phosphate synthase